jgi:choline dehydrogenase
MRGTGGPLGVTVQERTDDETVALLLASAQGTGWPFAEDVNAEDAEHIGFTPSAIKNGVRQSTANAFLWPIWRRRNLTIATDTTVDVLRFDGSRVVGATARHGGRKIDYAARKDVILAAGAIETPMILERSGIGRPEALDEAGVELRVESPNVGERIIEQHGAAVQVRFRRAVGHTLSLSGQTKQLAQGARYLLTRKGPVATAGYDLMAHIKSRPDVERPDIQVVAIPFALDLAGGLDVADYPGMYLLGYQIRPRTQSSLHITVSDPGAPPEIHANYLQDEEDRRVTGTIVDHLRGLLAQAPIAAEVQEEEFPGPKIKTPQDVVQFAHSPGDYLPRRRLDGHGTERRRCRRPGPTSSRRRRPPRRRHLHSFRSSVRQHGRPGYGHRLAGGRRHPRDVVAGPQGERRGRPNMTRHHETILKGGQEARLSSPSRRSRAPTGASLGRGSGSWSASSSSTGRSRARSRSA